MNSHFDRQMGNGLSTQNVVHADLRISQSSTPWVRTPRRLARNQKVRLFCLPYAGGSASVYRTWQGNLPGAIQVCPLHLPGREARLREALLRRYTDMLQALAAALEPFTDEPYAFFGHSMGAFLGYELALRFIGAGLRPPVHIFVSGRQAPHIRCDVISKPVGEMSDAEFVNELSPINTGSFRTLMENRELSALVLPSLRADFEICQTYEPSFHAPISVPISAFGGTRDPSVNQDEIAAWKPFTTRKFALHMIEGDHFFLNAAANEVQRIVRDELAGVA
jgi:surfactin synthase thioesterase subunit